MILSQIVAVASNGVIGKNNTLPWDLPEDMKFFREKTKGKVMIMGRKTFESLPAPLKGRYHIVVSGTPRSTQSSPDAPAEFVMSLDAAIARARQLVPPWPEEVFIIGGSQLFKDSFSVVDKIYLTRIHHPVEGDVVYPESDFSRFEISEKVDRAEPFAFSFITYARPNTIR